jgi:hypothetical protein
VRLATAKGRGFRLAPNIMHIQGCGRLQPTPQATRRRKESSCGTFCVSPMHGLAVVAQGILEVVQAGPQSDQFAEGFFMC